MSTRNPVYRETAAIAIGEVLCVGLMLGILIHGACVDSDFFHDTAQILARQFSVYTYDRRGYGRSNSCTDHTILTQVEDVVGLIRQISTPCHIVAHSGGTVIAMELAAKHPSLVRKLVLHEPIDTECMDIECDAAKNTG